MSTVAKILVVLNLALALVFLGSASNFLGKQESFQDKLKQEQDAHDVTRTEKQKEIDALETMRSNLVAEKNNLSDERTKHQTEAQRLLAEVTHLREAYDQLAENATRAQRAVDQLTNSLNATRQLNDSLTRDNANLRTNLTKSQDDRDAKVSMVNSLQMQLQNETEKGKSLESQMAALQERLERQAFRLEWYQKRFPGVEAVAQPPHDGRILAADNGSNVFVISLGEEDGVKPGFQYIVSRGAEYIATIQINNVQARQSAGFALKDLSKGEVRRGDRVMNGR
jgi:chromosome segregation ATPase